METNQLLINYYKKEEIKKVKQRQMEGLSNNEIINLANKTYITEEEIKSLLGIENEEKNINDESDFIIEDEEIENNKIVMINEKARFYRIHSMFYQIPPEIKDKSVTYKYDAYEVLKTLVNMFKH